MTCERDASGLPYPLCLMNTGRQEGRPGSREQPSPDPSSSGTVILDFRLQPRETATSALGKPPLWYFGQQPQWTETAPSHPLTADCR